MSEELARREIARAFADDDGPEGYVDKYIGMLQENWSTVTKSMVRTATFFLVLVAVFYLLTRPGAVEEVSVGPFKIKDLVVVATFIPLLSAYLYYDFTLLSKRWRDSRDVFRFLMERFHPTVTRGNFDILLQPQVVSFAGQTEHHYGLLGASLYSLGFTQS